MAIIDRLLSPQSPPTLFHYTNADAFVSIVSGGQLRASHVRYLNDSQEFHHGLEMVKARLDKAIANESDWQKQEVFESVRQALVNLPVTAYVVSLSEAGDALALWRGYCPTGGYNLALTGYKIAALARGQDYLLVKCIYRRDEQEALVDEFVDQLWNEYKARTSRDYWTYAWHSDSPEDFARTYGTLCLYAIAASMKNPFFEEEHEWRLVIEDPKKRTVRSRGALLIPQTDFSVTNEDIDSAIEGATIGPQPRVELAALALDILIEENNLKNFKYSTSEVPYRLL